MSLFDGDEATGETNVSVGDVTAVVFGALSLHGDDASPSTIWVALLFRLDCVLAQNPFLRSSEAATLLSFSLVDSPAGISQELLGRTTLVSDVPVLVERKNDDLPRADFPLSLADCGRLAIGGLEFVSFAICVAAACLSV